MFPLSAHACTTLPPNRIVTHLFLTCRDFLHSMARKSSDEASSAAGTGISNPVRGLEANCRTFPALILQ